jgi:hypothetical protein
MLSRIRPSSAGTILSQIVPTPIKFKADQLAAIRGVGPDQGFQIWFT